MTGFSAVGAFSTLLLGIVGVAIMWIGANDILAGRMTVGAFFSYTLYLGLLVGPVVQIVSIGSQVTEAFAGLERIREVRNELTEDAEEADREPLRESTAGSSFRTYTSSTRRAPCSRASRSSRSRARRRRSSGRRAPARAR